LRREQLEAVNRLSLIASNLREFVAALRTRYAKAPLFQRRRNIADQK